MKRAIVMCAIGAFVAGIVTLALAFVPNLLPGTEGGTLQGAQMGLLGLLGVAAIVAAMKYTMGNQSYGYQGLGDVYVMLFFGFVGVLGVGLLVSHEVAFPWVLPAVFSGCMSVAVLNLNNLRDHVSDATAGKRTMVVRLGFLGGKRYHLVVLALGWGALFCSSKVLGPSAHGEARCGMRSSPSCMRDTLRMFGDARTLHLSTPS